MHASIKRLVEYSEALRDRIPIFIYSAPRKGLKTIL
ncbi:Uncharacterised protein [Vibrio cholerae]|nr:Uncharacterised protein [Vibrio cholerae]CSI02870.1 Uncharacterised protein [Vibrio cholerae]